MSIKLKYLLIILFLFQFLNGISKEILIDTTFSSIDIYNSLAQQENTGNNISLDLHLKNNTAIGQQLYISIINPTIDRIVIYESGDSTILGDLIPYSKRILKYTNHVYPLFLEKDSNKNIRIVVKNQPYHVNNFRVNFSSENTFIKTTNHDNFFNGIFYGILFMYLLLLICFYIFSRSTFFTIYLIINLFMILIFFQYNGNGYQYMWPFSPMIQKYIGSVSVAGYLIAHISFIRLFFSLRIKQFQKLTQKIFIGSLVVLALMEFIQLYNRSHEYIYANSYFFILNGIFLIYGFTIIGLCIYTYFESKQREVLWVLVGTLLHIFNWVVFINNESGTVKWLNYIDNLKLFSSNIFVPQINYYITMTEMFVITVFISINYHKLIRQNIISAKRLDLLQKRNINTFVLGQEEEREKISNKIETAISKDIQHLRTSLENLTPLQSDNKLITTLISDIDKTVGDINNITSNYVAPDMQQMKLAELITTATDKLFYHINTSYDFKKIPENLKLNAVANINLYRIFQEISNNILKHSAAKNVTITAIKDNKTLQLKITDDGIGFSGINEKNKGIGLMNIESRMISLNGNFYLLSNEKKGSTIDLFMSLKDIT